MPAGGPLGGTQHARGAEHIGAGVADGVRDAGVHAGLRGKVDDALGRRVGEPALQRGPVTDVQLRQSEPPCAQRAEAVDIGELDGPVVGVEVVDAEHAGALREHRRRDMRADEPGRAGDHDRRALWHGCSRPDATGQKQSRAPSVKTAPRWRRERSVIVYCVIGLCVPETLKHFTCEPPGWNHNPHRGG